MLQVPHEAVLPEGAAETTEALLAKPRRPGAEEQDNPTQAVYRIGPLRGPALVKKEYGKDPPGPPRKLHKEPWIQMLVSKSWLHHLLAV